MPRLKTKKIKILKNLFSSRLFLPGCISVFVFLLASPAHADIIESLSEGAIHNILGGILSFILGAMINITSSLAEAMDTVLRIGVTDSSGSIDSANTVVRSSWLLVRNFSNMFFIIGLIIMAFATIFDVSRYNFRSMIVKFLIVALLLNFSLVIGETIIDWTQSISSVFLTAMGSFGNVLGQGLDPAILLGNPETKTQKTASPSLIAICGHLAIDPGRLAGCVSRHLAIVSVSSYGTAQLYQMFFSIILGSIITFSLLVGVVFTAIRIPILWALLILAPAAWVCSIFPPLADTNRKWWKLFLGWNFFLPIYLAFLYFGLVFLQNQSTILGVPETKNGLAGIGFSFQVLFFYGFVGVFMISGVKFAMSGGMAAGAGGVAGAIWAKGTANARLQRGTLTGGAFRMTGIPDAYKDTKAHIQREGFAGTKLDGAPIIGGFRGQRGLDETVGSIKGALGLPGARQGNIQSTEEGFRKAGYAQDKLDDILKTGSPEQKIAAANILKGQHRALTGNEVKSLYGEYKKLSPADAAKWIRGQKDAIEGLGKSELDELEKTADPQMQQFIARIKAKRDLIPNTDDWKKRLGLFTNDKGGNDATMASFIGESKDFIEKLDPDTALEIFKDIPATNRESVKKFANLIAKKGIDTNKLKELTDEKTGAFESTSEREAFLNLAKEGNMVGALQAKMEAGVLRDLTTNKLIDVKSKSTAELDKILEDALVQEYGKATPKTISSYQFRKDDVDPSKNLGLADPRALKAFKRHLEESRPERVADFYRSDEYMGNRPVVAATEQALKDIRQAALKKDKLDPLQDAVQQILGIHIPEIKSAKNVGDKARADKATVRAQALLDKAERLDKSISSDNSSADENTKDMAGNLVANAKSELTEAKNYRKP